jgi:hypothetical protein
MRGPNSKNDVLAKVSPTLRTGCRGHSDGPVLPSQNLLIAVGNTLAVWSAIPRERSHLDHWLHGRARLTPALLAIYLAGSAAVLGGVGVLGGQPRSGSETFTFPNGNGTVIVQFLPAPEWGSYALHAWFPGVHVVNCFGGFCPPGGTRIYSSVSICTNARCTSAEAVGYSDGANLFTNQTDATRFFINVSSANHPQVMVVSADYYDAEGLPTGGLNLQLLAGFPALGGLAGLPIAVVAWRYDIRPLGWPRGA